MSNRVTRAADRCQTGVRANCDDFYLDLACYQYAAREDLIADATQSRSRDAAHAVFFELAFTGYHDAVEGQGDAQLDVHQHAGGVQRLSQAVGFVQLLIGNFLLEHQVPHDLPQAVAGPGMPRRHGCLH